MQLPRHTIGVMIVAKKMVVLAIPSPCFGNVYFAEYMLVVLLLWREIEY